MKVKLLPLARFVPQLFQISGMRKAVGFSPTSTTIDRFFRAAASIRVRLMCNWVRRKCGFYSSAASNRVRLLYTTLRYLYLYAHRVQNVKTKFWEKTNSLVEAKASENVCENKQPLFCLLQFSSVLNSSRHSQQKCWLSKKKKKDPQSITLS